MTLNRPIKGEVSFENQYSDHPGDHLDPLHLSLSTGSSWYLIHVLETVLKNSSDKVMSICKSDKLLSLSNSGC